MAAVSGGQAANGAEGYASSYRAYVAAGWVPLPLPYGKKGPPPRGFTGAKAPRPDLEQYEVWASDQGSGNLAVRLPEGVLGIDVDAYAGKQGDRTIAALQQRLSPLPRTFSTGSRDDGVSGIRLYEVPAGLAWRGGASTVHDDGTRTADVDLIHAGYRYAVAAPSVHPEGRRYCWRDQDGQPMSGPPAVADLPALPGPWVQELTGGPVLQPSRSESRGGPAPADSAKAPPDGGQLQASANSRARSDATNRWLSTLAVGPPCDLVAQRGEELIAGLVESSRHASILGPLMSLLRLGQQRHRGVPKVVSAVETSFLEAVNQARPKHAASEWKKALDGAVSVINKDGALPAHPACACVIRQLRAALQEPELFTKGVAGLNERKVMRYLVMRADGSGSLLVQESQRQIAVAIDVHQPSVSVVLKRLQRESWLTPQKAAPRGAAAKYLLNVAGPMEQLLSTEDSTPAEYLVDTSLPALVHPLFGADGLRAGVAETFAALPERWVRVGKWVGIYTRPGAVWGDGLRHAYRGSLRVPLPARGRGGASVAELAARTGKNPRTILNHLARLIEYGLVSQRDDRWYRLRFDPQALVAELGIEDTSARKALEYDRQRRGYYDYLCLGRGGRPPTAAKEVLDGRVVYVDRGTGAQLWSFPLERVHEETA